MVQFAIEALEKHGLTTVSGHLNFNLNIQKLSHSIDQLYRTQLLIFAKNAMRNSGGCKIGTVSSGDRT